MNEKEIKEFFKKKEVVEYLKNNLKLYLDIEPCEGILGYDVTADVFLGRDLLAHREEGI